MFAPIRRFASTRRLIVTGTVFAGIAAGVVFAVGGLGVSSSSGTVPTVVAARGSIIVSVTGSGPVSALGGSNGSAAVSAKAGAGSAPAGSGVTVGFQVLPQTTGQVLRVLVVPGQVVQAGQPLAVLGDPNAVGGLLQAQISLRAAQLTMLGSPPSRQEVAAAQLAVKLAREKLAVVAGAPAGLTQARLDLANAHLAEETLRHGPTVPTQTAMVAAKLAVTLAEQKLGAAYQPASQSALLAAQMGVSDAQAKLNALAKPPPGPLPSELSAAQLAVTLAKQQLAALSNPTAVEKTTARLAVAQAQAALDKLRSGPPPPDAAALTAAQQAIALANVNLAALSAPVPTAASVVAAQRDLRAANVSLLALQSSATPPDPAALAAAQQSVASAGQYLSALIASPQLAGLTQARVDLVNARNAYDILRRGSTPTSTAATAAQLAVNLGREKLAGLTAGPPQATVTQARLDIASSQVALTGLLQRGVPTTAAERAANQLKIEAARQAIALAQLHEQQLTVTAPVAGTVTGVFVSPGATVDPTVAVASIADLKHLYVTVNMSEFDIANIKLGDTAIVNVGALGGTALAANVVSVAPVGVSNAGVVQFPVTVALTKPLARLRIGMLASVEVVTAKRRNVVRVPLDAIGSVQSGDNAGQTTVTLLDGSGKQRVRFVDLGLAGSTYAEVVKGLKGGERLVLPQATSSNGGSSGNAPPGIGVPPPSQDQGNAGGGGG